MNPVEANSAFVTTSTSRPKKGGWRCTVNGSGGRRPFDACHDNTLRTIWSTRIRNPMTPCSAGGRPVVIDVKALAVVDGATVVIGPPVSFASSGSSSGRPVIASQPSPSMTRTTTVRAARVGSGSHGTSRAPSSAGTTFERPGPS